MVSVQYAGNMLQTMNKAVSWVMLVCLTILKARANTNRRGKCFFIVSNSLFWNGALFRISRAMPTFSVHRRTNRRTSTRADVFPDESSLLKSPAAGRVQGYDARVVRVALTVSQLVAVR